MATMHSKFINEHDTLVPSSRLVTRTALYWLVCVLYGVSGCQWYVQRQLKPIFELFTIISLLIKTSDE